MATFVLLSGENRVFSAGMLLRPFFLSEIPVRSDTWQYPLSLIRESSDEELFFFLTGP